MHHHSGNGLVLLGLLSWGCPAAEPGAVTLVETGDQVELANGTLSATISKHAATLTALRFRGLEMLRSGYYSMDGGQDFRVPGHCRYSVTTRTPELVDLAFHQPWTTEPQAFAIEIHYALKRGDTALYSYAILDHPATYPATAVGEWRFVWKLSDDLLEQICVDDLRHWRMQASSDAFAATPIKEIIRLTSGIRTGQYDCKYDFNANYHDLGCWGHASDVHQVGAWIVLPSHEFFNDGPTKQDLTAAYGINHLHFGLDHYNASTTRLDAGQAWSKLYGPFLLYCNHHPQGAAACWKDAQERARLEQASWPCAWLRERPEYPPEGGRGAAAGTFAIHDRLKPLASFGRTWIGLAQPAAGGSWQFDSLGYQYWVQTGTDGRFAIPHVRPGTYTLYAFADGAVGEFAQDGVRIAAGQTLQLGALAWEVPHRGAHIAWEIGLPDRTAREFRHGDDYFHGYRWEAVRQEFPNPLDYLVGTSHWERDLPYVQAGHDDGHGTVTPHEWRIRFRLPAAPAAAATLTLAIASADRAAIRVQVNEATPPLIVTPAIQGGNALLREGIHAKYCVEYLSIPADQLRAGDNVLSLSLTSVRLPSSHVMYDYLSLEVP